MPEVYKHTAPLEPGENGRPVYLDLNNTGKQGGQLIPGGDYKCSVLLLGLAGSILESLEVNGVELVLE